MPITIFSPNGEAKDYRTVSERLPVFEKLFPIEDGYRVIRSHISVKQFGSDLHHLYEKAIESGHSPRDMGLPFVEGFGVIFRAELFKGDTLIRNASAYKQVAQTKDWEAGETAAFQRLMAACGLGGSDMDADDQYDRISSGLEVPPPYEPESAPAETVQPEAQEAAPSAETEETPESAGAEVIRPQLLNQLAHVAALAGEPVPQVNTVQEAKAQIKRLNTLSRAS